MSFGLEKIRFLGQVVNRDSIHLDSSKDAAVHNWKRPETDKDLSTSRFSRVLQEFRYEIMDRIKSSRLER